MSLQASPLHPATTYFFSELNGVGSKPQPNPPKMGGKTGWPGGSDPFCHPYRSARSKSQYKQTLVEISIINKLFQTLGIFKYL